MLEMGKVYYWDEIAEAYPDMYAIITDIEENGGIIGHCRLLEVVPFEKKEETMCKYLDLPIKFMCKRTTYKAPNMGVFF